jgi:hypothetical protein
MENSIKTLEAAGLRDVENIPESAVAALAALPTAHLHTLATAQAELATFPQASLQMPDATASASRRAVSASHGAALFGCCVF